jgi:hypothetical protein
MSHLPYNKMGDIAECFSKFMIEQRRPMRQEGTGFWVVLCGEKLIICILHQILLEWTNQGLWCEQVIEHA